jgi:hypothetical protein
MRTFLNVCVHVYICIDRYEYMYIYMYIYEYHRPLLNYKTETLVIPKMNSGMYVYLCVSNVYIYKNVHMYVYLYMYRCMYTCKYA